MLASLTYSLRWHGTGWRWSSAYRTGCLYRTEREAFLHLQDMLFLESSQLKSQSATPCLSLIKELIDEHHVCSCNALLSLTQIQEGATCLKMWITMRELDRIHLTIWSMMNDDLIQHLLFMMTTKTALVF